MSTTDPSPESTQLTVDQFLTKLFAKFDSNSDGRLSSYEFTEALKYLTKVLGTTLPNRTDVQEIFGYLDSDSDRTISREEFKQLGVTLDALLQQAGIKFIYKGHVA